MSILYHILLYNQKESKPYRDCRHQTYSHTGSTYNDFIDCIINGLNKHKDYHDIQQEIRQNRHKITIYIGSSAKSQNDLLKQKITNNKIVNINDIVSVPLGKCVFLTHGIHTKSLPKNRKKPKKLKTKTITKKQTKKHNTNTKRKRSENIENNSNTKVIKPALKRRKKLKLILSNSPKVKPNSPKKVMLLTPKELEYECLWILIDATTSLSGVYEQNAPTGDKTNKINKILKVKECVENIINNNWMKNDCPTHYISLYSYNKHLRKQTNVLKYCNENKTLISNCLNNIQLCNIKFNITWTDALLQLVNIIQLKKNNIKCANHRIVLFCGKQCKARLNTMQKAI
eukprot:258091_1